MGGRLDGKIAVITGGASGIGAAAVRIFVREGASVVIADLQAGRAAQLAAELGPQVRAIECDVTVEAQVAAAVDLAVSEFGRLDVMVNNAGLVGAVGSIAETSDDHWQKTVAVLLDSVFYGMKHAARVMKPQGSGSIISVSSTAGLVGGQGPHAYTAAKWGVRGLTESVASELAQYGIRVNAVSPGTTFTPLIVNLRGDAGEARQMVEDRSPLRRVLEAEDIANGFLYLASEEARNVTAHTLVIDAGCVNTSSRIPPHHMREAGFLASTKLD